MKVNPSVVNTIPCISRLPPGANWHPEELPVYKVELSSHTDAGAVVVPMAIGHSI